MALSSNKLELQKTIIDSYEKLNIKLKNILSELTAKKELEGYAKNTLMSERDLVAYLVGWGRLVLKCNERKTKGVDVDFPETGFKWNELGQLAQKVYKDYEQDSYVTLTNKLDKTVSDILNLIEDKAN